MKEKFKTLLADLKEDEFIDFQELRAQGQAAYPAEDSEFMALWMERVTKAKKERSYRSGPQIAALISGLTPDEIIKSIHSDYKNEGRMVQAADIARDLITLVKKLGKNGGSEESAPRSKAIPVSGFMSFVSRTSGHRLPQDILKLYNQFKTPSQKALDDTNLDTEGIRDMLFKIYEHCTLTEKAMLLFFMQTGISRSDNLTMKIPPNFFKQLEDTAEKNHSVLAPYTTWLMKRYKMMNTDRPTWAYLCLYGDAARWYLKYAESKGLKEGDPFFVGHGGEPMTPQGIANTLGSAGKKAKEHLTPKMLRKYQSGVLKEHKIDSDVWATMTGHQGGDVGQAYTYKTSILKACEETWPWFNPDMATKAQTIKVEEDNRDLKIQVSEMRTELAEFKQTIIQILTAGDSERARAFRTLLEGSRKKETPTDPAV